jgi:hypothetical protein
LDATRSAGSAAPQLTIVTDLHVGGIDVHVGQDR